MKKVIKLNHTDLEVIFDVLNVFTPSDISHVYPEMGEEKFLRDVNNAWKKVLDILRQDGYVDEDVISADFTSDKKSNDFEIVTNGDKKLKEMLDNHDQN